MRILVEPSDYIIRNIGDTAMMTVALERIAEMWPQARIQVFSEAPDELPRPGLNIEPLETTGRRLWFDRVRVPIRWRRYDRGLTDLLRYVFSAQPNLCRAVLLRSGSFSSDEAQELVDFLEAVRNADLLVVTGMGGITSAFPTYALELLEVVRIAQRAGTKTVMLGQGLGPIETGPLRRAAATVLRRVELLALRERRAGLPLLQELRVPLERVVVTGDDAIELAQRYASGEGGDGIGINMRHAVYSGVQLTDIAEVREVLLRTAARLQAPLVGVPISRVPGEEDHVTIERLAADRIEEVGNLSLIRTPEDAVVQLRRCRILIAGSYHAAVFALASGIPTVALAHSAYYVDKLLGLADMFGAGCVVIRLDEAGCSERIAQAVLELWDAADALRPQLLAATEKQLRQSRAAYARLKELVP